MGYRIGETAGPYVIERLLGRGNFGEVLLAKNPERPNHPVALKTITCDQLSGESADNSRKAALSEAQLLRRLRHPHIVTCDQVEWDVERRTVWFALEFMDGGDVQSLIDARRLGVGERFEDHFIRRILAAVGSALRYIHRQGILHRDVKPANILLTRRSQRIKLGDFGISKILEASAHARTLVGTPYYLAPEIVSGQAYGVPADAWALGVCLYELAALRRPFEGSNPLALVRRICEELPAELAADVPADINRTVFGMLQRQAQDRMNIEDALRVSDAVRVLATSGFAADDSRAHLATSKDALSIDEPVLPSCPADEALNTDVEELLSPVSMASDSAGGSNADDGEFAASIFGRFRGHCNNRFDFAAQSRETALPSAVHHARVALNAEVDDPEELKEALLAVEQEAAQCSDDWKDAMESLVAELRLRIAAVRADAIGLLQSLLDGAEPMDCSSNRSVVRSMTELIVSDEGACCPDDEARMTALETAIEDATALGVDTCAAEAKAASARGLLGVRVYWGSAVRCCMLRLGATFSEIALEVSRRFGMVRLGEDDVPALELIWREGADVVAVRDQATWEACLRRCGMLSKPGRLELHVELPFMVQGQACRAPATRGRACATRGRVVRCAQPLVSRPTTAQSRKAGVAGLTGRHVRATASRHIVDGGVEVGVPSGTRQRSHRWR